MLKWLSLRYICVSLLDTHGAVSFIGNAELYFIARHSSLWGGQENVCLFVTAVGLFQFNCTCVSIIMTDCGGWMTVVIECTYCQSRVSLREIPRMKQPLVCWSWLVNKCIRCVRYSLKVRQGLRMSRLANMNLCCKHSKYMTNTVSHLDTFKTNGYRGRKRYRFHCKISTSTVKLIQV